MASIFKRKRRLAVPSDAKTSSKGDKRFASWKDRHGRSRRAPIVSTENGDRIEVEDRKWSIMYFTAQGKRRMVIGAADKKATEAIARKIEAREYAYRHGARDEKAEENAKNALKPIKDHIEGFKSKMVTKGCAPAHIDGTISIIERFIEAQKISTIDQISADRANKYAAGLNDDGMKPRTIHAHLTALKAFTRWLVHDEELLPADRLVSVKKPSPERQRERRYLQPDEFARLMKAARSGPDRYGMDGKERALLYDFAVQTGLRLSEIRSLKVSDLHLDESPPYARCRKTKNKKIAQQYLLPHLAAKLAEHVERKVPGAAVFALPNDRRWVPQALREDLEQARTVWLSEATKQPKKYRKREQSDFLLVTNHAGQHLDFHALRHTCGTWASMAGASPKAVQKLMRHRTITLTLDTYGHLMPDEAATTVQRIGQIHPEAKAG